MEIQAMFRSVKDREKKNIFNYHKNAPNVHPIPKMRNFITKNAPSKKKTLCAFFGLHFLARVLTHNGKIRLAVRGLRFRDKISRPSARLPPNIVCAQGITQPLQPLPPFFPRILFPPNTTWREIFTHTARDGISLMTTFWILDTG